MSLDDLSASELARIDSICLKYESSYRRGNAPEIADVVDQFVREHGEQASFMQAELLRKELELVRDELQSDATIAGSDPGRRSTATAEFRVPNPGTRLGPYVIGETIGRGGMGVVLEAVDERLDRKVAIKMLATDIARRGDLTERFQREARSVATISHPNVVELFDVGSHQGLPYAVMEYLEGELLSERMKRKTFSVAETRDLGSQIADALAKSHHAGVIHRDLKPQNIMLVPRTGNESSGDTSHDQPLVKLFDFGLSRAPRDHRAARDNQTDETDEGVILGTPGYMAPEQALGETATESADIFALGCILFEAFYGKRAFDGTTKIQRHRATLTEHPDPDPIRRRADLDLAILIDQCLAKNPSHRPESASLIAKQLRQRDSDSDRVLKSMRSGQQAGRFTRRRLVELAAGGAAGAAVAVFLGSQNSSRLSQVRSIGVLSFDDESPVSNAAGADALQRLVPIGTTDLRRGEELAAMLVHELAQIPSIVVPPFRPLIATGPEDYRRLGKLLNVDALLDGSIRKEQQGTKEFLRLDVRIVSANDGIELDGFIIRADADASFLQQSRFASEIATRIGHRLTSSASSNEPPSAEAFKCLVDGKVRCDPDSPKGLEMALMCFSHAHEVDIRFAEPLAGLALTSITLAAQTAADQKVILIANARQSADDALERDPRSIDARLAVAMLDWQTEEQYASAEAAFQTLLKEAPNNWQVHHQFGLLQLAIGRMELAIESFRAATLRNPLSVTVKTDLARAYWFAGDTERAIEDTERIREKFDNHDLAVGLLIDIREQQQQYSLAAALDDSLDVAPKSTYFAERQKRLSELPYGPFGDELNLAILKSRTADGIDNRAIAELADAPMPPMLSLVLTRHPSFAEARTLPRSKEILVRLERRA